MHTVTVRRTIAAPAAAVFDWLADADNYRSTPSVLRVKTHPVDGREPFGVGASREIITLALKVVEDITVYERPHHMGYRIRSSIPPVHHDGGSVTCRETDGGTEATIVSSFEFRMPVLAAATTRLYAPLVVVFFRMLLRSADRQLTR